MKVTIKIFSVIFLIAVILLGCSSEDKNETNNQVKNETIDIKELVHDYSVGKKSATSVSITSQQLIVTESEDEEEKVIYELPENEFFVSIAPYINETHPCFNHSLSGCQGEMVDESFLVVIEDADGNVIMDETLKTQANGFIDLWLPRNETYRIAITYKDKVVQSEFSTFEEDGTCITTIQIR